MDQCPFDSLLHFVYDLFTSIEDGLPLNGYSYEIVGLYEFPCPVCGVDGIQIPNSAMVPFP